MTFQKARTFLLTFLLLAATALTGFGQVKIAPNSGRGNGQSFAGRENNRGGRLRDPAEHFMKTISERHLEAHLEFLASDLLEGRETGKRGQHLAAEYIATQFERMGLAPGMVTDSGKSWFQQFELEETKLASTWLSFDGKTELKLFEDWVGVDIKSIGQVAEGEFVFAGYGIEDEQYNSYSGVNVKGKIALVLEGEPFDNSGNSIISGTNKPSKWTQNISNKREAAKKNGAAGIVVILRDVDYANFKDSRWVRHRLTHPSLKFPSEDDKKPMPFLLIPERLGNELIRGSKKTVNDFRKELVEKEVVEPVKFKKNRLMLKGAVEVTPVMTENVLGVIEGMDKRDEVVVLTAHYDHLGIKDGLVYNGADDDGSGVVALLEIAEAFSQASAAGYRPRRTILFMPVSGEEKGLLGSKYYTDNPVYPLEKTVCNLNIDMIGRVDQDHIDKRIEEYVYIIGSDRLSKDLHELSEAANKQYTRIELDYAYNAEDDPNRFYYRSDHYNFAKNDIPVIFYFTGVHEDYHKHTDTEDKIMYRKMSKIVRLVFVTAWNVANREERLKLD